MTSGAAAKDPPELAGPDEGLVGPDDDVAALIPMLRRIVGARVGQHPAAEDLVQETLARVLAARDRIEPGMLEPYAITTVRNLVATMWRRDDREVRNRHRLHDPNQPDGLEESVVATEEQSAITEALGRLTDREREILVAHEVSGQDTRSLADEAGSTAGAVAAQLKRTRARLRVEYLLALEGVEPPTEQCRPVLLSLSSAERRRQRELDAPRHLLECDLCARLSGPLLDRGPVRDDQVTVPVRGTPTSSPPAALPARWRREPASRAPTSPSWPPRSRRWPATS